jgi:aspartyl protease family protein
MLSAMTRVSADVIELKNGRSLEGLITQESRAELVLDFGYGSTVVKRSEIAGIRRSSAEERSRIETEHLSRAVESGTLIPGGCEEFASLLQQTRKARESSQDARAEEKAVQDELEQLSSELDRMRNEQASLLSELAETNRHADSSLYRQRADKVNALEAKAQSNILRRQDLQRRIAYGESAVRAYLDTYAQLQRYAEERLPRLRSSSAKDARAEAFFSNAAKEIARMSADFEEEIVAARSKDERHLSVSVLFNGKVRAPMIVDTGAVETIISPELAERLGMHPSPDDALVTISVADGRTTQARAKKLDSIAVGKARVDGARVLILNAPAPGIEGLLGMSFLNHFLFQMDMTHNRLILHRLAPSKKPLDKSR